MKRRRYEEPKIEQTRSEDISFIVMSAENPDFDNDIVNDIDFSEP